MKISFEEINQVKQKRNVCKTCLQWSSGASEKRNRRTAALNALQAYSTSILSCFELLKIHFAVLNLQPLPTNNTNQVIPRQSIWA